jgi:hypothetical protein
LVPLDSLDIATLPERVRFFFYKKSVSCQIFNFSGLGGSSFRRARISAQGTSGAHIVALAVLPYSGDDMMKLLRLDKIVFSFSKLI